MATATSRISARTLAAGITCTLAVGFSLSLIQAEEPV
ncbi:MAG TPA: cytochrome-c peroxidase, partial [Planctomycetaceae bacterium]|nr:cytochrome-c peroxidase [Planctomycetaceae bacterium]